MEELKQNIIYLCKLRESAKSKKIIDLLNKKLNALYDIKYQILKRR